MDLHTTDRREFVRGMVRACLLGGLTCAGALLVWRRWRDGACADAGRCRGCRVYAVCPLSRKRGEARS